MDCKHYLRTGECDHPAMPVLPTTGRPVLMALNLRVGGEHPGGRGAYVTKAKCGADGLLFVPINGLSQVGQGAADAVQATGDVVVQAVVADLGGTRAQEGADQHRVGTGVAGAKHFVDLRGGEFEPAGDNSRD
jgi:hypothetical protein